MYRIAIAILGEPSYIMNKFDINWFPCLNLGHDKVNIASLQATIKRATRTELRRNSHLLVLLDLQKLKHQ